MNPEIINKEAMVAYINQEWLKAQSLFRQNAYTYSSHETYNNWGIYLVTEGMICKNGAIINAYKLGLRFLKKANSLKKTYTNFCALATAIEYEIRTAPQEKSKELYEVSLDYLNMAISIKYSNEIQYNILRTKFMIGRNVDELLDDVRMLVQRFVCNESVSLYLELLRIKHLKEEVRLCIEKYEEYIDKAQLIIACADLGLYDEGFLLCESVYNTWVISDVIEASIFECCVGIGNWDKIEKLLDCQMCESARSKRVELYSKSRASEERRKIIREHKEMLPYVIPCCYFGCILHDTRW